MKNTKKIPRKNSLVVLKDDLSRRYVFLGEIPNMPGHCVVIHLGDSQIERGFHTIDFRELTDEEI